jgi:predicted RNase H-like nuclease
MKPLRRRHLAARLTDPLMTSRFRQGEALPITQNPAEILKPIEREGCNVDRQAVYIGIDGCKAGWIAVLLSADAQCQVKLYASIYELWEELRAARLLLIDMPIGLPPAECPIRQCDRDARRMLKPRRASAVFPAPIRAVLQAGSYEEANMRSKQLASRGLSKQTWHLVKKIRELDLLLQSDPTARGKLVEAHPELSFAVLSDSGQPMLHNKKTKLGFDERIGHLQKLYPQAESVVDRALKLYKRKEVARDDVVDALILAVTALVSGGIDGLTGVPLTRQYDELGLPMQIVFYRKNL